jgi:hypothetical protein
MFQLPLSWPSELIRKYKQKNERKILLNNNNDNYNYNPNADSYKNPNTSNIFFNENENNEEVNKEKIFENSNYEEKGNIYFEKTSDNTQEEIINKNKNRLDEEFDIEGNYNIVKNYNDDEDDDDDDFILGQKLKKMNQISEMEKNCEDLHGWDEDYYYL